MSALKLIVLGLAKLAQNENVSRQEHSSQFDNVRNESLREFSYLEHASRADWEDMRLASGERC